MTIKRETLENIPGQVFAVPGQVAKVAKTVLVNGLDVLLKRPSQINDIHWTVVRGQEAQVNYGKVGAHTVIGDHTYLRHVEIGEKCVIGNGSDIQGTEKTPVVIPDGVSRRENTFVDFTRGAAFLNLSHGNYAYFVSDGVQNPLEDTKQTYSLIFNLDDIGFVSDTGIEIEDLATTLNAHLKLNGNQLVAPGNASAPSIGIEGIN